MSAAPTLPPKATVAPGQESRAKAWGFTGLLVALYIVNWGDKAVLGLAAQPLKEELGLTASQIGLVGSAFFLTFTIGGFFAGTLNKFMALRWSLAFLVVGWSVAMLPLIFSATFIVLLLSRMLLGLLEGPSSALIHTGAYSWHPREKRGLPSACLTAAASIAKIIIAPALALLMATQGWRAAFLVLAGIGIVWLLVWLPTWKLGPYGEDKSSLKAKAAAAAAADSAPEIQEPVPSWGKIFTTWTFMGGALAVMSMYALVSVVLTWLPSYFETGLGYGRVEAGAMFGFPSIASLVVMFTIAPFTDRMLARGATSRLGRGIMPAIGLLACGISMAVLPLIGTPAIAVAVVSIGYALGAAVFPLFNSAISEIVPARLTAGTLGIFLAIMSLGGLIAPYLTGVIVDGAATPAEGYAQAFQVFGIFAIIGGAAALLGVNPERDRAKLLAAAR